MSTRKRSNLTGSGALLFVISVAVLLPSGCGQKAPPFLPVPVAAQELKIEKVVVRDGDVRVEFRVPRERYSIREEDFWVVARLLRRSGGAAGEDFEERVFLHEVEGFEFEAKRSVVDRSAASDPQGYVYKIEMRKEESKDWAESEPVTVRYLELPGVPGPVGIEGREGAVALSWNRTAQAPEGLKYVVSRRGRDEENFQNATPEPLSGPQWVDTGVPREKEFCYRVGTVLVDGPVVVEGPVSDEACAATEDRTSPPAPGKVEVRPIRRGLRLTWLSSEAADLEGYNIYRSEGDGPFRLVNGEPLRGTDFLDESVEPGRVYRYRVTAVDDSASANESPFSSTVEGQVPAR